MTRAPQIVHGDCLDIMKMLPDNSVDSIVTDPPYGLGFMGKAWDALPPGREWAEECLRVLKPGGHLLAFGGSRTWHRLAVSVEDAGFEIRDSIAWLYGSGFPKSLDVSKAIDKLDAAAERVERARTFQGWLRQHLTPRQVNEATGTDMGYHLTTHPTQPAVATAAIFDMLRPLIPEVPNHIEELVRLRTVESKNFAAREVLGERRQRANSKGSAVPMNASAGEVEKITAPATPAAQEWQGWGTALKPAFEPVVVARKPLIGTVAANVQAHGTGALNIDAARIGSPAGRWPANVALDEHMAAVLDGQSGVTSGSGQVKTSGVRALRDAEVYGKPNGTRNSPDDYGDAGGASRFFYVAKAPKKERPVVDGIAHATVKPLALMRWLVRLVTPEGGTVLEPFAGSGTTVEACILEGFHCIAIEREAEYLPLIQARIERQEVA